MFKNIIFLKTTLEKRQFLDQENRMISETVNIFASGIALKTNLSKPYKFVNSRGTRAFKRPQKCQNRVNSGFWSTPYSETLHVGGGHESYHIAVAQPLQTFPKSLFF